MKKAILSFTSLLLLLSCSNNNRQSLSTQNEDTIPFEIIDTISEKTVSKDCAESTGRSILPSGYSKKKYTEYIPKNDIERHLFADLKEMTDNSIEDSYDILGISFSRHAIDKVLTKD